MAIAFIAGTGVCLAMIWSWMSPEAILKESDFIGIIDVKEIHEVTTPEGFRLQTARATIEKVFAIREGLRVSELEKFFVIYSFDPSAAVEPYKVSVEGASFSLRSGRAFVCLKQKGIYKFYPYFPLSFQHLEGGDKVRWPGDKFAAPYPETPLPVVVEKIQALQKAGKGKKD